MQRINLVFAAIIIICTVPESAGAGWFSAQEDSKQRALFLDDPKHEGSQQAERKSTAEADQTPAVAGKAIAPPLTGKEKFRYYLRSTYGPASIASSAATSALEQARDAVPEWGQGMEGYGRRYASSFGQKAIEQFIQFGVGALLREDPRYRASARTGLLPRAFYAAGQTFVSHKDSGGTRFAYSRFIGTAGGVCIARQWHPENDRSAAHYAAATAISIGLDAAKNVFNEFWPDIKRRFRR